MVNLGVYSNLVLQFKRRLSALVVVSFCIINTVHITLIFQERHNYGCHREVNEARERLRLRR